MSFKRELVLNMSFWGPSAIVVLLLVVLVVNGNGAWKELAATEGHWLNWTGWSQCSQTCGESSRKRVRNCLKLSYVEMSACEADSLEESENCTTPLCPSTWADWKPWERCENLEATNDLCQEGTQTRRRMCQHSDDPLACQGLPEVNRTCSECVITGIAYVNLTAATNITQETRDDCTHSCRLLGENECQAVIYNEVDKVCSQLQSAPSVFAQTENDNPVTVLWLQSHDSDEQFQLKNLEGLIVLTHGCAYEEALEDGSNSVILEDFGASLPEYDQSITNEGHPFMYYYKPKGMFILCANNKCYTYTVGMPRSWILQPSLACPMDHVEGSRTIELRKGVVMVIGGRNQPFSMGGVSTSYILNLAESKGWEPGPMLPYSGIGIAATKLNQEGTKIMICGGYNHNSMKEAHIYDFTIPAWTALPHLPRGDYAQILIPKFESGSSSASGVYILSGAALNSGASQFTYYLNLSKPDAYTASADFQPPFLFAASGEVGNFRNGRMYFTPFYIPSWTRVLEQTIIFDYTTEDVSQQWTVRDSGNTCNGLAVTYELTAYVKSEG